MIHIIPAAAQHSAVLASLSRQTFVDAFGKENNPTDLNAYVDEAFSETTIRQELLDPNSAFYLAYLQEELIGYLKLRRGRTPSALRDCQALELQRIYVQQRAIGRGVGARLMQAAVDYARQAECYVLWLGVWERSPSAIAFYQKWGFTKFSTHTFMIGQDAQTDWLMQKLLTNEAS
jgi:GNAT superfamily N-acetyltransferase